MTRSVEESLERLQLDYIVDIEFGFQTRLITFASIILRSPCCVLSKQRSD